LTTILSRLKQNPTSIFLIDGIGAFLTFVCLLVLRTLFDQFVGMPRNVLLYLTIIALVFCLYSITCFFIVGAGWRLFLKAIVTANLLYCLLTIGLVIFYHDSIHILGMAYFFGEIVIICVLVTVEVKFILSSARNEK